MFNNEAKNFSNTVGFFNPILANGMFNLSSIPEKHIKLADENLINEYRTQRRTKELRNLFVNFFNIERHDKNSLNGICQFYIECINFLKKNNNLEDFLNEQESLVILNRACEKNKEQLFYLARLLYNHKNGTISEMKENIQPMVNDLFEKIKKIEQEVEAITSISKENLLEQGTVAISKKYIYLENYFADQAKIIQSQAKQAIVDFASEDNFSSIALLSQKLAAKDWSGVCELLEQHKSPYKAGTLSI